MYSNASHTSLTANYFKQKIVFVIQCYLVVNSSDSQQCDLTLLTMFPAPRALSQHSQRDSLICAFH